MPAFGKQERLCSQSLISELFRTGQSFAEYPLRAVWLFHPWQEESCPAKIVISVPRKTFRSAVKRNRIKRLIREAYRMIKEEFYYDLRNKKTHCSFMIIYTGKKMPGLKETSDKLVLILQRIAAQI